MSKIVENRCTLIDEDAVIEGQLSLGPTARVHGKITGQIISPEESELVIGETAVVEGNIRGDHIFIDGYVRGNVEARRRVVISGSGRLMGDVRAPNVKVEFGAFFEGKCEMERVESDFREAPLSPAPA